MSCVSVLSRLHNAVGNLATYICLRQSFVAISFERCRYFLAHVAFRNLPWQGLFRVLIYSGSRNLFSKELKIHKPVSRKEPSTSSDSNILSCVKRPATLDTIALPRLRASPKHVHDVL